jgi:TPP-dependent pyruvate/acetoin dehydrogenase alpha subunit/nucleoside-diphosphate-sugar epimerase
MNRGARIFVAGGDTLIGAALLELLTERRFTNVVGVGPDHPELTDAREVDRFFADEQPEFVFLVGGKSGGIGLNRERPADLMLDNLRTIANVINSAHRHGAIKLLYLASSCAYPKAAPQPLAVESLLTGPFEQTSEAYATAKLAGWKLCQAYRQQYNCQFVTGFPANPFGPDDDFSAEGGHVVPSLIRRAHEAKENGDPTLTVWGTGKPRREFIFSRDLADACLFVMQSYDGEAPINLGGGIDLSIADAARTIVDVVGFRGQVEFDQGKPDGAPLKALDSSVLRALGWRSATDFRTAVAKTYDWFLQNSGIASVRKAPPLARPAVMGPMGRIGPRGPITAARVGGGILQETTMHARLYRAIYRIRRLEEEVARVYATDKIKSPVHLSIGQEAVSVGVCDALRPADVVFGTYRGHALYLAKGGDLNAMVAELYGKATGCTKGKGGSMHLVDPEAGVMGMSAVVGTTIANAAGYAYALKHQRRDSIVVSFFGDGATEEGVFSETLNFAVLKQLPILFVCENNGYAIHTAQGKRQGRPDICARAEAFGMPAKRLDGNNLFELLRSAKEAVAHIRFGGGPRFLEVATYRWREHVGPASDFKLGYRSEAECEQWVAADPLRRLADDLPADERTIIEQEVESELAVAFANADASPFPGVEELMSDVFKEDAGVCA